MTVKDMSVFEIYKAAGLTDPVDHAIQVLGRYKEMMSQFTDETFLETFTDFRRLGKTTALLVKAISAAANDKKVVFRAEYASQVECAKEMLEKMLTTMNPSLSEYTLIKGNIVFVRRALARLDYDILIDD